MYDRFEKVRVGTQQRGWKNRHSQSDYLASLACRKPDGGNKDLAP